MQTRHIEICSPLEAAAIIARMKLTERENKARAVEEARHGGFDFALHGYVDAWFRNAKTGKIEDEIHQPNLITDLCRRAFNLQLVTAALTSNFIITSPSAEPALLGRYTLCDAGTTASGQTSVATAASYDAVTLTKSWLVAFAVPPANRRIGAVGVAGTGSGTMVGWSTAHGALNLYAYTVISPVKTQATTQTLEVNYRITLTPTT
jgi:hypothetical protein